MKIEIEINSNEISSNEESLRQLREKLVQMAIDEMSLSDYPEELLYCLRIIQNTQDYIGCIKKQLETSTLKKVV